MKTQPTVNQEDREKYIVLDKETSVFSAYCNFFGRIEEGPISYKAWYKPSQNSIGHTFALNYKDAINFLHDWLIENADILFKEFPEATYYISHITETGEKTVYTISTFKAKKYLI